MDSLVLRDGLSATGVDGPGRAMAVGSHGQIIFKKSPNQLYYYDVQELSTVVLQLKNKDPLYDDCQIYDLAFVRGSLLLCLQRPSTGDLFICEGHIDTQEKTVDIGGAVHKTKMRAEKGKQVCLLEDEAGVVLLSTPIRWNEGVMTVQLFHASNYLQSNSGDKYTISLSTKDKCDATFGASFISRNHLYMFYAHDYSKFLLVPLAGSSCGKCQVRSTSGSPPNDMFMGKVAQVFEDYVLVYAHMNIRKVQPNIYMMNLTNLKWQPINLALSHHFPNGKVSFQKVREELIYLHGDCNVVGCPEKSHLYQINVEAVGALLVPRIRSSSTFSQSNSCIPYPSISACSVPNLVHRSCSVTSQTPPTTPTQSSADSFVNGKPDPPVIHRFKKKQSREEAARRRYCIEEPATSPTSLKRSSSSSSLHWCADMAEQSGLSLQEQLKLAHEMGFGEEVVLSALDANQKTSEGPYEPFESTNSMLDLLNQAASGRGEQPGKDQGGKMKLSIYNEKSKPSSSSSPRPAPRSSSVTRSSSFHVGGSRSPRHDSHDLFRLIHTLDREKERDKREVEQQFAILKTRIHEFERERDELRAENERLTEALNEQQEIVEQAETEAAAKAERVARLEEEASEMREKYDRLTIDSLHLEKDLDNQKELLEHRKKKHEEELGRHEEAFRAVEEKCRSLSAELERKSALLDEQTDIARRMEQRNSSLQSGALLELIAAESKSIRKHQEEAVLGQNKVIEIYEQVLTQFPVMEAEKQRVERDLQQSKEEKEVMGREIRSLLEKSCSECCICLTTKPSVVFLPCRHLAVCSNCADESSMTECPTCRSKIDETLKIYC